jgi:hypothetical protein
MEAHGVRGGIALTHSYLGTRWGWVVSITPRPRFTPGTHCTGGWVGPRAGLNAEAWGKILCLCRGSTPVVQSVVRHCTYWATPAPLLRFIVSPAEVCRNSLLSFQRNWPCSLQLEAIAKIAVLLMTTFPRNRQISVCRQKILCGLFAVAAPLSVKAHLSVGVCWCLMTGVCDTPFSEGVDVSGNFSVQGC